MRACPDCHNRYEDEILHCPEDGRGLVDTAADEELIGRTIGSYRVERLLGKGGMGSVYMGVHPRIGSRVAIKFLHAQYSADEKIVDRFYNEARAVNVIGHDNILKILDLDVTAEGRHYFVMEFLHGRSLQALLRKGEAVPLEVAGPILAQVCDALEAAHRKGIVHRDLKPDNVHLITMKGKKNFVKVVDFGIARLTEESGLPSGQTQTGMVMGTPAYMSPEQGSGATSQIDGRSDVYSLGIVMFQLATGRLPFTGANFGEVLVAHLQQPPPRPRSLAPSIPEEYEAIILRCLEKRKEDRYASMRALKVALEACMDRLGLSRDLPMAGESDEEPLAPVESRPPSNPGPRTPRPLETQPTQALQRARTPGHAASPSALPPTVVAPAPKGRVRRYAALGSIAVAAVGVSAFLLLRQTDAPRTRQRAAIEAALQPVVDPPVVLAATAEPADARVSASWKDGEKKGTLPLSFEVPRFAQVHLEFSKEGYMGDAMDVIADQPQTVRASLRAVPQAPSTPAADPGRKRPSRRRLAPRKDLPSQDALIDVDEALK